MPITRLSPLTIAAFVMVVLVVLAGIFVVLRPRHDAEIAITQNPFEEAVSPSPAPTDVPPAAEEPRLRLRIVPTPAPAPEPIVVVLPPVVEATSLPTAEDMATLVKRRGLIIAAHKKQLVDEADEKALEVVKASDATRAAIRRINDEFAKRIEAIPSPRPDGHSAAAPTAAPPDTYDAAEAARRAAIGSLLDRDDARAFEIAEQTAELALRAHYRRQWGRELRANAPLPSP